MGEQVAAGAVKKERGTAATFSIDTGKDEQPLINANPISREVLFG